MKIEIDVQSFWHAGSGRGDGPNADELVIKTREGLPFLPGRTLKGLLRDGFQLGEKLGHAKEGMTREVFGGPDMSDATAAGMKRFNTKEGRIHVTNAELGKDHQEQKTWREWARANPEKVQHFYKLMRSTSVDEKGVVVDKTLRVFEYTVPVKLYADIQFTCKKAEMSKNFEDALKRFLPLIRSLGVHRNRGYGRCEVKQIQGGAS